MRKNHHPLVVKPRFPVGSRIRITECWVCPHWNGHTGTIESIENSQWPISYHVRLDKPIMRSDGVRFMERVVCTDAIMEIVDG